MSRKIRSVDLLHTFKTDLSMYYFVCFVILHFVLLFQYDSNIIAMTTLIENYSWSVIQVFFLTFGLKLIAYSLTTCIKVLISLFKRRSHLDWATNNCRSASLNQKKNYLFFAELYEGTFSSYRDLDARQTSIMELFYETS